MTNLDRWRNYTRDFVCPDSFIEFGYYFLVAAALQRRVWLGDRDFKGVFPNIYVVLVGNSGVGKTLITRVVSDFLKHHIVPARDGDPDSKPKYLFPTGADTSTFEKLVNSVAKAIRTMKEPAGTVYIHTSVYFALEELSSMVRKNQDQVIKLLLNAFDAGDYVYETKHCGEDRIRRCCVSLLAGTTPDFMQESFDSKLMAQGFTARCVFVYETIPRFRKWEIPDRDAGQRKDEEAILEHIQELSKLYGRCRFSTDADAFLKKWWEESSDVITNRSPKLVDYYAKKNLLVKKLCMARHFGECAIVDAPIEIETCQYVLDLLANIEAKMHLALNYLPKNHMAPVSKAIMHFVSTTPSTEQELLAQFFDDIPGGHLGLQELLRELLMMGYVIHKDGLYYRAT